MLLNDYLFGKELFIRFTVRVFRECYQFFVCRSFPFGFEGGLWNVIVFIPDHCFSIYFTTGLSSSIYFTTGLSSSPPRPH